MIQYRLEYKIFYTGIGDYRTDSLYNPNEFIMLMNENSPSFNHQYSESEIPKLDPVSFLFADLEKLVDWAGADIWWYELAN